MSGLFGRSFPRLQYSSHPPVHIHTVNVLLRFRSQHFGSFSLSRALSFVQHQRMGSVFFRQAQIMHLAGGILDMENIE